MRHETHSFGLIGLLVLTLNSGTPQTGSPVLKGPYLGQKPPGMEPEIFAPGVISKAGFHLHSSLAFSPDASELCFTKIVFEPESQGTIYCMRREMNVWSGPRMATFSGKHNDDSPVFSPDGSRLYFTSTRPVDQDDDTDDLDIWFVTRAGRGWGEPTHAGSILNTDFCDFRMSFARDGTMYLSSDRDGQDSKTFDVFTSRSVDGEYSIPEKVGGAITTPVTEQIAFVAPDERYVVFYRHDRQRTGDTGLYISFRDEDGSWSTGANMGARFNSPPEAVTQAASLSPDGKYVFFLRRRHETIYWVDSRVIESSRR